MRRTLWTIALVGGIVGGFGGLSTVLAATISPSDSQSVAGNGVTVFATLLPERSDRAAVRLTLDTYFVNLTRYDLQDIAILRDETGKTYPVAVVEPIGIRKPHYRQAILRFAALNPDAKALELIVKDVAGVTERTFRWTRAEGPSAP